MFYTALIKNQLHYSAQTWQQTLKNREIAKNNFRVTKDMRKAKAFVSAVTNFTFSNEVTLVKEFIIFSSDLLAVPLDTFFVSSLAVNA